MANLKQIQRNMILNTAEEAYQKRLAIYEKKISGASDKLQAMHDGDSSVRARAKLRANLSTLCEGRDAVLDLLQLIGDMRNE